MENSKDVQRMSIEDIPVEDGAMEMANSPNVEPYLAYAEAALTGRGGETAKKALRDLPLRERYVWRVLTGLKLAFCDFDRSSVRLDLSTMNAADFDAVVELIDRRMMQFAMLLRTVFGSVEMKRMLLEAVEIAKRC